MTKEELREEFEKIWLSISVGHDGSEADAMKRDEILKWCISEIDSHTKALQIEALSWKKTAEDFEEKYKKVIDPFNH